MFNLHLPMMKAPQHAKPTFHCKMIKIPFNFTFTVVSILILALLSPLHCRAFAPANHFQNNFNARNIQMSSSTTTALKSKPFAIVVEAEIKPDRLEEFLDIIEKDAIGSRAEPGCIRFDVLQMQDNPNKFFFYEVYEDLDAVSFHTKQPYFTAWTEFEASGGVVSAVIHKNDGLFLTE